MVLTGEVSSVEERLVEVTVRGENSLGTHLSGTVTVELPELAGHTGASGAGA